MQAKAPRVYPLGIDDRKLVDKTFDKLHEQEWMLQSTTSTLFSYPVFIIWKILPSRERKGQVVIDIYRLNQISQTNVYPLPLQLDIIAAVQGCKYITVVDCASFFYQWRVHPSDCYKLTVISHRGQEHFNVCVMGFKNSPIYVQHYIDILLQDYLQAYTYIDDVVIASHTLKEHIHHL